MARTDEQLVAAAQGGDRRALEELLERHQGRVFRFGMKMCGEPEDAKDVLQETLMAAARTLPEFRGASSVTTWLYAIARSFCIKRRRTGKFSPAALHSLDAAGEEVAEVPDQHRAPDDEVAGRQLEARLQEAIASLEPMYREVLVLRDVEGLSAAEVGEVLGLTVEAVKSRLHRARVAVRARVAPFLGIPDEGLPAAEGGACPEVLELFSRKLEGEISGPVCEELEEHVRRCPRCSARCDSLRASLSLCRRAGEETVPPRIELSVRTALRKFIEAQG
jgi:RNA polymerase sigma-70 factor (ECF subfamily)